MLSVSVHAEAPRVPRPVTDPQPIVSPTIAAAGGTPLVGSLGDLDVIRAAARDTDGIVHAAFGLDFAKIKEMAEEQIRTIQAFGEAFAGTDRPIIVTGSVLLTLPGEVFQKNARPQVLSGFPRASEQSAFALAERGLRVMAVRNPRSVHGQAETHGFVPMLAAIAREKGISAWLGEGDNLWPAVHRLDCARLYGLALERGVGVRPITPLPSRAYRSAISQRRSGVSSVCPPDRSHRTTQRRTSAASRSSQRVTVRRPVNRRSVRSGGRTARAA